MKYLKTFWSTAFQQGFGILVISLAAVWFIFCFDSSHPGKGGGEGPQSATAAPMPRTADSVAQSIIQSTKEDIDRIQKGSTKFMFLYNRQPKDCNDIARVVQLADAFSQSTRTYSDPDRIQGKTTRRGETFTTPVPCSFYRASKRADVNFRDEPITVVDVPFNYDVRTGAASFGRFAVVFAKSIADNAEIKNEVQAKAWAKVSEEIKTLPECFVEGQQLVCRVPLRK